jgi:hypothetical protein
LRSTADRLGLHLQDLNQNNQALLIDWLDSTRVLHNGYTRGTNPEETPKGYPALAPEDEGLNFDDLLPNRPPVPSQEPLIQADLRDSEDPLDKEFYKTLPKCKPWMPMVKGSPQCQRSRAHEAPLETSGASDATNLMWLLSKWLDIRARTSFNWKQSERIC